MTFFRVSSVASIALLLGCLATVSECRASVHQDFDLVGELVSVFNPTASGQLDIVNADVGLVQGYFDIGGFVPGTAVSGDFYVWFTDHLGGNETATVKLENIVVGTVVNITNSLLGQVNSFDVGSALIAINVDGKLDWSISKNAGFLPNFTVVAVGVVVEAVPEPLSVIVWGLLGLTFVGGHRWSRRRSNS